ncbi:hypothetical protein D8799_09100 [Streptococcus cristatus]|nr:hypothetical protein D8799_09100 [Streptococcus cristatus]
MRSRRCFPDTCKCHALAIICRILLIITFEGPDIVFFFFNYRFFSRLFGYNGVSNLIRSLITWQHSQNTLWQWNTRVRRFEYIFWIWSRHPASKESLSAFCYNDFFFIVSCKCPSYLVCCINISRFTWLLSIYFCKEQTAHLIINWVFRSQLGDMIW